MDGLQGAERSESKEWEGRSDALCPGHGRCRPERVIGRELLSEDQDVVVCAAGSCRGIGQAWRNETEGYHVESAIVHGYELRRLGVKMADPRARGLRNVRDGSYLIELGRYSISGGPTATIGLVDNSGSLLSGRSRAPRLGGVVPNTLPQGRFIGLDSEEGWRVRRRPHEGARDSAHVSGLRTSKT